MNRHRAAVAIYSWFVGQRVLLAVLTLFAFSSCIVQTSVTPLPGRASLSAAIAGVAWETTTPPAAVAILTRTTGELLIHGENFNENGDISSMVLVLHSASLGQHALDSATYFPAPKNLTTAFNMQTTSPGVIDLSELDTSKMLVGGTYHFVGKSSSGIIDSVTSGVISNVPLTLQ